MVESRPARPRPGPQRDLAEAQVVEERVDQLRLELDPLGLWPQPVPGVDRPDDRPGGRLLVEVADADVVVEQVGQAALEPVQPGQGVLADGDQEVGQDVPVVDDQGELLGEGVGALLIGPVQEVLLELVEDDQDRAAHPFGPDLEGVAQAGRVVGSQRLRVQVLQGLPDALVDGGHRLVAPVADDHHHQLGLAHVLEVADGLLVELVDDAGPQHRALADPGGAVQHGEGVGEQVRPDDPLGLLAAEEEPGVVLVIGRQALEGDRRAGGGQVHLSHHPGPAGRAARRGPGRRTPRAARP